MPDQIHLTVATICHKNGELLMVEEMDQGKRVINQPAGHVENGESLKTAALRETLEETGYIVDLEAVLGLSVFEAANGITYYRVSFLASCPEQQPSSNLDKDIERALWMMPEDILRNQDLRSNLVSLDVKRFLSGTRYPLEMIDEKP